MKCKTCSNESHQGQFVGEYCKPCHSNQKIDMLKKYRTESGLAVRILYTNRKDTAYPVVALVSDDGDSEVVMVYQSNGKSSCDGYSLVEVTPFDDFKTDDVCVVSDLSSIIKNETPVRSFGYFSYNKGHQAYIFNNGKTSLTSSPEDVSCFYYCRKATPEEIKSKTINPNLS